MSTIQNTAACLHPISQAVDSAGRKPEPSRRVLTTDLPRQFTIPAVASVRRYTRSMAISLDGLIVRGSSHWNPRTVLAHKLREIRGSIDTRFAVRRLAAFSKPGPSLVDPSAERVAPLAAPSAPAARCLNQEGRAVA